MWQRLRDATTSWISAGVHGCVCDCATERRWTILTNTNQLSMTAWNTLTRSLAHHRQPDCLTACIAYVQNIQLRYMCNGHHCSLVRRNAHAKCAKYNLIRRRQKKTQKKKEQQLTLKWTKQHRNVQDGDEWWHHRLVAMSFRHPCQGSNQHWNNAFRRATNKFQLQIWWMQFRFHFNARADEIPYTTSTRRKNRIEKWKERKNTIELMKLIKCWHSKSHTNSKMSKMKKLCYPLSMRCLN